uniref:Cilium assembly protein DZIP1 domain-containing protein n=1 Tax=Knipowitschia caucasica TaxID=637954 RepID=A0AAV2LCS2_KNICA
MRREMEFLYTRNIQVLNEANQQQSTRPGKSSPVQVEPEKDLDNYKEKQKQAMHKLEQQLKKQDKKWAARLEDVKDQHKLEKNKLLNELNRMQITVAEHQDHNHRLRQDLSQKLQEKEQTIKSQREQLQRKASSPPAKIIETQVLHTSAAPEPKQRRVVLESSVSEARPVKKIQVPPPPQKKKRTALKALRKNPNLRREMRPEVEKNVMRKLQSYGVKPNQSGLKLREMESILVKVRAERKRESQELPDYWSYRQEISDTVHEKLGVPKKNHDQKNKKLMQVLQIHPRSNSLPSRAPNVVSVSSERLSKTPQAAPRSKSMAPKTSTPKDKTPWMSNSSMTPPFSSDEESEDEETDSEEAHQLDQRNKVSLVQNRSVLTKQASVTSINSLQSRAPSAGVTKMDSEDEDDWSEVSELQEIDPKELPTFKDQNGNVEKKSVGKENKIVEISKKIEKQFTERLGKKPAGGISILAERKDEVQELSCTDLDESNEWVSSLEEKVSKPVYTSVPLRRSLDSASTSVWGTSTGKGPKSSQSQGLTEAKQRWSQGYSGGRGHVCAYAAAAGHISPVHSALAQATVHFIPMRVRTPPKNPVMTAQTARALQACKANMEGYSLQSETPVVSDTQSFHRLE